MTELMDGQKGEELKKEGITLAMSSREEKLAVARKIAVEIALQDPNRECTADLVQQQLVKDRVSLGNAAGALFAGKNWTWTGRFQNSKRASNHSRVVRVWKYVGA